MDKWTIRGKWDGERTEFFLNNEALIKYIIFYSGLESGYDDEDTPVAECLKNMDQYEATDRLSPEVLDVATKLVKCYLSFFRGSRDRDRSFSHEIVPEGSFVSKWYFG
jgi:hypothetical protein